MIIERNPNSQFSISFTGYSTVAFHATSSLASSEIEKVGFLPNKVFDSGDHQNILSEAKSLSINTSGYEQWLQMRSITFTKNQSDALNHIKNGSSGGQGLGNIITVLRIMASLGSAQQKTMANNFIDKIDNIRRAYSIIYAVDLSNIGGRLVSDPKQTSLYQIYFCPNAPLPSVSIVTPANIIARLEVV